MVFPWFSHPCGPQVGPMLAYVGSFWSMLPWVESKLAQVDPSWPKLAPSEPQVGSKLAPCRPMLVQVGTKLAPSWPQVGPCWPKLIQVSPNWPHVGPKMPPSWPMLAHVGPKLAPAKSVWAVDSNPWRDAITNHISRMAITNHISRMAITNHISSTTILLLATFGLFQFGASVELSRHVLSFKTIYSNVPPRCSSWCFFLVASSFSCIARRHSSKYVVKYIQRKQQR